MAFIPSIPLIRKKRIIKNSERAVQYPKKRQKTLADASVINPNAFARLTEKMLREGSISKTAYERFYLTEKND